MYQSKHRSNNYHLQNLGGFWFVVAVFVHSQCIPGRATFLAYFTNGSNVQVLGFNVLNDPLLYLVDQPTLQAEPVTS